MDIRPTWTAQHHLFLKSLAFPILFAGIFLVTAPRPGLGLDCPPCDDGSPCTEDVCDTTTGICTHPPVDCDDGNQCTIDTCDPLVGCRHFPNSRAHCDDGNACTLLDECIGDTCYPGVQPRICNDSNACTLDSCNRSLGCVFTPTVGGCDDGDACTGGDACDAGQCRGGPPVDCNDGNVCTDDACDRQLGCMYAANAAPCDDNSACTQGDACSDGVCSGVGQCPCADQDEDGYADCDAPACDPAGLVCGDCDDGRAEVRPDATETCNHVDDDCDHAVDEGSTKSWHEVEVADPAASPGDRFGAAVARIGDVDGDGIEDLAIGAPGTSQPAALEAGSVVVLSGADRSVHCRVVDPAGGPNERLGFSVAALDDMTGDGVPDLVAGAPGGQGRVVIISGADCAIVRSCRDSVLIQRTTGPIQSNLHPSTVVAAGDANGDGVPDILAGDPTALNGNQFVLTLGNGRVVLFSGINCSVIRRFTPLNLGPDNVRFGASLGNLGDLTGDGVDDLAIGSLLSPDVTNAGYGRISIYSGSNGSLLRTAGDFSPEALFGGLGSALAVMPDLNGDGVPDLAAGEPQGDAGGLANTGAVVLFSGADGAVLRRCTAPDADAGDQLGQAQAVLPDLDGDGIDDVVASAPLDDTPEGVDAGSLVVFSSADCSLLARLFDGSGGRPGARLGDHALAPAGDLIGDASVDLIAGWGYDAASAATLPGRAILLGGEADCDGDGSTPAQGDCDDGDAATRPGATEICDARDNDCDGQTDEGNPPGERSCDTGLPGDCAAGRQTCEEGASCTPVQNPENPCFCAFCGAIDIFIERSPRGSRVLTWNTTIEWDIEGFNVIEIDRRGTRRQVNVALIPCHECSTGRGSAYSVLVPKYRNGRDLFVEQVHIDGRTEIFGPATPR